MQPPIAAPNEESQRHFEGPEVREFRLKFWPYFSVSWLATFAGVALFFFALNQFSPERGLRPSVEEAKFMLALGSILMVAMIGYIWRFMPLQVGHWGVRGVNFWATPCQASWEQMSTVKFVWMGVPYAVVSCGKKPKLWVWLSLEKPDEFAQAVAEFAPPDHPLRAFLRERS